MEAEHVYCKHEGDIQGLMSDMENVLGWQKTQNGSIQRIEAKVDKMYNAAIVAGLAFIANLIFMLLR